MGQENRDTTKRLNFFLSDKAHAELTHLSKATRKSMTEIIRLGVGLAVIALEAQKRGQHLVITDDNRQALREIVIPS